MEKNPKFNDKDIQIIMAQLYVSKGLSRNPVKMIKFMKCNKKFFPTITEETIQSLMTEYNLTQNDIDIHPTVNFTDLKH
jgi:uncharacterized protein YneF (UPF0154 family)